MYVPPPPPRPQVCYADGGMSGPGEVVFSAMSDGGSAGTMTAVIQSQSLKGGVTIQSEHIARSDGIAKFTDNRTLIRVTLTIRDPREEGRRDLCEACYTLRKTDRELLVVCRPAPVPGKRCLSDGSRVSR